MDQHFQSILVISHQKKHSTRILIGFMEPVYSLTGTIFNDAL